MLRKSLPLLALSWVLGLACDCRGNGSDDAGVEDSGLDADAGPRRMPAGDAAGSALDLYVAPADERIAAAWVPRQPGAVASYVLDIAQATAEYDFARPDAGMGMSTSTVVTGLPADTDHKLFVTALDSSGRLVTGFPGGFDAGTPQDAGPQDGGPDGGATDAGVVPDAGAPEQGRPLVSFETRTRTGVPSFSAGSILLTSPVAGMSLAEPFVVPWDTARLSVVLRMGTDVRASFSDDRGQSWLSLRSVDYDVVHVRAAANAAMRRLYACYVKGTPGAVELYLSWSDDLGKTWKRSTVATGLQGLACDVTVGQAGNVYVVGQASEKLTVWRSSTNGAVFEGSADIPTPGSDIHSPRPRLATDPGRNNLYLAYEVDGRAGGDGGVGTDYDVLVARSVNGGLGFDTPRPVMACLPRYVGYNQTDATIYVNAASPKGTIWVGFTDERGNCTSGCPSGVLALSDDQGLTWECTSEWTPGRDLGAEGDVRGSPLVARDFNGRLFVAFPARSRTSLDFSLYLTRFDPEAQNRRGEFFAPDAKGSALSKKLFAGTLKPGDELSATVVADPHASMWVLWPGASPSVGPGIYASRAP